MEKVPYDFSDYITQYILNVVEHHKTSPKSYSLISGNRDRKAQHLYMK